MEQLRTRQSDNGMGWRDGPIGPCLWAVQGHGGQIAAALPGGSGEDQHSAA